jgi:hypothetical protein
MKIRLEKTEPEDIEKGVLVCVPPMMAKVPNSLLGNCFICDTPVAYSTSAPPVDRKVCLKCFSDYLATIKENETLPVKVTEEQMAEVRKYTSN